MRRSIRMGLVAGVAALVLLPQAAAAQIPAVSSFDYTQNMHPMGHSARIPVGGRFNSDLAFWGKTAYQGTYEGFRIIDITEGDNPVEINNYAECSPGTTQGNQGDVIVWENLLVRSWNSPATATSSCDGELVGAGFEGLHVFDISDPSDPDLVGSVPLASFGALPHRVTIANGPAAGTYPAAGATWGTPPTLAGLTGNVVAVNDGVIGVGTPSGTITGVMVSQADGATIRAGGLPVGATIARNPGFGCGSHTATGVPDLENDRLLVYNSSSAGNAGGFFENVGGPPGDPGGA